MAAERHLTVVPPGAERIWTCPYLQAMGETLWWLGGKDINKMDRKHLGNSIAWMEREAPRLHADHLDLEGMYWEPGAPSCTCPQGIDAISWVKSTPLYHALVEEKERRPAPEPIKKVGPQKARWVDGYGVICRTWIYRANPHMHGEGKIHFIVGDGEYGIRAACRGYFGSAKRLMPFDPDAVTCLNCIHMPQAFEQGERPNWAWEEGSCEHTTVTD